jgi:hypothetical protein
LNNPENGGYKPPAAHFANGFPELVLEFMPVINRLTRKFKKERKNNDELSGIYGPRPFQFR